MSLFAYEFVGKVAHHGSEDYKHTVVFLPDELVKALPFGKHARLRVRGEIEEHPFAGAWQPEGGGRKYLMLPKAVLKERKLSVGDWISVRFNLDDPEAVDIPEELATMLRKNKELKKLWDGISAGKKRSCCHYVTSVKSEEARLKRVEALISLLKTGFKKS